MLDVEALADLGEPCLGGPPLQCRPAFLHGPELVEHVLAGCQARFQRAQRHGHCRELTETLAQERGHAPVLPGHPLGYVRQPRARSHRDRTGGGCELARQHAQQRGLAGAVGPDDTDPVAFAQDQVEPCEEQVTVVGLAEADSFEMCFGVSAGHGCLRECATPTWARPGVVTGVQRSRVALTSPGCAPCPRRQVRVNPAPPLSLSQPHSPAPLRLAAVFVAGSDNSSVADI